MIRGRARFVLTAVLLGLAADQGTIAQQPFAPNIATGIVVHRDGVSDPNDVAADLAALRAAMSRDWTNASAAGQPPSSANLTINAIFDSTITSDANAAAIESTINAAISDYAPLFTDPITVTIVFEKGGGLGSSSAYFSNGSYSSFIAALRADAKTSDDSLAIAPLPSASTNPVNGNTTINVKTANLRAIGINVNPPSGQPDGFITLNTNLTSPGSPGTSGQYDLRVVVQHEIDEVLGLSSALPSLQFSTIFPQDLFRYDQNGSRTFTTTSTVLAYFSFDGVTRLAQFDNQNDGGDFGDWQSNPLPPGVAPQVQDAFATAGSHPTLGVELRALDTIGYDRAGSAPSITAQPQSQTIAPGATATLSVTATGTAPLAYQWHEGVSGTVNPISGATSSSYTTPPLNSPKKYWVRVSNSFGTADSATAVISVSFTDPTITATSTIIRAAHILELRTRVDALRAALGLGGYPWTDPTLTVGTTVVRAAHVTDLRSAVTDLYSRRGMTPPTFTGSIAPGVVVLAQHVIELRSAVVALE